MPVRPVSSSGRAGKTAPVTTEVQVALPSYPRTRAACAATGPIVEWHAAQEMPSSEAAGSTSRSGSRAAASRRALHGGIEAFRFSPGEWQLTHHSCPPAPVTDRRLRESTHTSPPRARRTPAPFGQRESRPTCSSTKLSSAPTRGLRTANAIADARHWATSRAWQGAQSSARVPSRRAAPMRGRAAGCDDGIASSIASATMAPTTGGVAARRTRAEPGSMPRMDHLRGALAA